MAGLTKAGSLGHEIWISLSTYLTAVGTGTLLISSALIGSLVLFNIGLDQILLVGVKLLVQIRSSIEIIQKFTHFSKTPKNQEIKIQSGNEINPAKEIAETYSPIGRQTGPQPISTSDISADHHIQKSDHPDPAINLPNPNHIWELPPLSLLDTQHSGKAERGDIKKNASIIEQHLESFNIRAKVKEVNLGPAVTQYALEVSLGTKLSKITSLTSDLAMALAAKTGQIRVEAPIPGRSLVGIELPNHTPEFVGLKRMLQSEALKQFKSKLGLALGLNVAGNPIALNLSKMPHLLIAGSTGSGKSVCINTFIANILFRATPDEVKFILIDPKRVELTRYNNIPHLLTPVIVEPKKVLSALKWLTDEMDHRYKLFSEVGARNLESYNELSGFQALPYILVIVDELADIMLFAPSEVEDLICRLAQMARATGIHLIISTQRPSVDVLTGLIKANIPARIAFAVSSMTDSRVVLDTPGAEKLLGQGDMLFLPPDQAKPTRIQGAFITDSEVNRLLQFVNSQGIPAKYTEEITTTPTGKIMSGIGRGAGTVDNEERDERFDQAVRLITSEKASASLFQRKLSVGYARAARILDQMENIGLVGPKDGSKPREVHMGAISEYIANQNKN
jgi:S-DNA-T family DNA segregation ATPase FtsK/SpoIIIE